MSSILKIELCAQDRNWKKRSIFKIEHIKIEYTEIIGRCFPMKNDELQ